MDVFKIELQQSQITKSLVESSNNCTANACNEDENNEDEDDEDSEQIVLPEVSFDATSDFNLHFFDTPEDSSTQGGCSEPASVESETLYNDDEQQFGFIAELDGVIEDEHACANDIKQETNTFYGNNEEIRIEHANGVDDRNIKATTTATTATTTALIVTTTTTTTATTTSEATISFAIDTQTTTTTTSTAHIGELTTVQAIVDDITAYERHNHQKQQQQQQQQPQQQPQQQQQYHNNNLSSSLAASSPSSYSLSSSSSSTSSCSSNCSPLSPISTSKAHLCNRTENSAFLSNTSVNNSLNFIASSYADNQYNNHQTYAVTLTTANSAANAACRSATNGNKSHISGICSSVQATNQTIDNFISNGHNSNVIASSSTKSLTNIKIEHHPAQQQQQQSQGM